MSCRVDRLDAMDDVLLETHGSVTLHEAIGGLHKGNFIVWDNDKCVAVGKSDWARRHLPNGDRYGIWNTAPVEGGT